MAPAVSQLSDVRKFSVELGAGHPVCVLLASVISQSARAES